jgi:dTDP-4-dehydrorhamnose reductase
LAVINVLLAPYLFFSICMAASLAAWKQVGKEAGMRLLVTGASGQLGSYFLWECRRRRETVIAWSASRQGELFGYPVCPVDIADPDAVAVAFRDTEPHVVVHTAAVSGVSDCQREPQRAERINTRGSAVLAELAERANVPLIHVSTDMVFNGEHAPYREEDPVAPLSIYGRTKAEAERAVHAYPRHMVVRLPLLFGPTLLGRPTFFDQQVLALRQGQPLTLFHDEWRTPLSLLSAARALLALAGACSAATVALPGLLHVGGPERLSRLQMGQRLAAFFGCDATRIAAVSRTHVAGVEARPADLSLDSSRWRSLFPDQEWPTWEEALSQLMAS